MKTRALLLLVMLAGCRHDNGNAGNGNGDGGDGGIVDHDSGMIIDPMVCASQSTQVKALGADLLFVLDTSYSMDYNLKWASISAGLKAFINDPRFAGVGVGLQYFPLRTTCDIADYAMLAVPVSALPNGAPALNASINSKRMSGGTPTVPAMEGVLAYASQSAAANPDRRQVIVLATDGVPDDSCPANADMGLPNSIGSVVQLVQKAASATPPVLTFVVGVGSELTALDAIAAAGGGAPKAFLVDTTQDIESAFAAALDQIRKKALECEFVIPMPAPGLVIDYSKVNVNFTKTTTPEPLAFVGDASGCAKAATNGWYYDDPKNPTKVVLCDQTCQRVRDGSSGEVDVVFGCAQLVP